MAEQRHNGLTGASSRCRLVETALLVRGDLIRVLIPRIEVTFFHFF
jgi:hypothetical protein